MTIGLAEKLRAPHKMGETLDKVRRGLRKPPSYILERLASDAREQAEKVLGPRRARRFGMNALLEATGAKNLEQLWSHLKARSYPALTASVSPEEYRHICPDDFERITRRAEDALAHRVDLLGSGLVELGTEIDWHKDYKTNLSWPMHYCRDIDYRNPERRSDVKFPWEVSRMQWVIPAGQAYLLTGNETYAWEVRQVIEQWIAANPYAYGVNWASTIEVALRILSWSWFFHVFAKSKAWSEPSFQGEFLRNLYLHGVFTEKHIEKSDINGNHYTADAAGLVFAGLFFGECTSARRWADRGWNILAEELPRQVYNDGVDFEGSVAYHRMVFELFLLPGLYRAALRLTVPEFYQNRLARMARFTAAYSRADGSVPLWGDADDARALPFGPQTIGDHRYVLGLAGCVFAPDLKKYFSGSREEIFWLLGKEAAESLPRLERPAFQSGSTAFPDGGFYVMRNECDHVFVDCGPVGLAGRGGHGHNDLLSFEAVLDGVHLITDCGSYVYTADYAERNRFRSTAYHNTPMIDGEEINRFVAPNNLWALRNDARPVVRKWDAGDSMTVVSMSHTGYERLDPPVFVSREVTLDHARHALTISDHVQRQSGCQVVISFHFSPDLRVALHTAECDLVHPDRCFLFTWNGTEGWAPELVACRTSPRYGVTVPSRKIVFRMARRSISDIYLNVKISRSLALLSHQ